MNTADGLPAPAEQRVAAAGLTPCEASGVKAPLTLLDTVRRALCFNPKTRQAWAGVEAQAAAVGVARSAYLPTVNVSASVSQINLLDNYPDQPEFDSSLHGGSNEETIGLNWVVYDFGLRSATLRSQRALLDAASTSEDDAVQSVFIEAAKAYFGAVEAQAKLAADADTEAAAHRSMDAVEVKVGAGVAAEADWLQVKTAYAQASLNRIHADESLQNALGMVAVVVGSRPGATFALAPPPGGAFEDITQIRAMADQLIDRAMRAHPKIAAAQARLEAARNGVSAARAAGRPSLAFAAIGDRSDNPINRVTSRQTIETSSVGLQLTIPLFEGFGRTYRVRQAEAEVQEREADLFGAQQEVAQDVWESYVAVRGSADDLRASRELLDSASQSFNIALGRYKSGVGSLIELLKAQSDLAMGREQDVVARTHWSLARLQLAASLGQIDLSTLRENPAKVAVPPLPSGQESVSRTKSSPPISYLPGPAPAVSSVGTFPATGAPGFQLLTIEGRHFLDGAKVQLHDKTHHLDYPSLVPFNRTESRMQIRAGLDCAADWTAEVVNPDGRSSGEVPFKVAGKCSR
ncbi:MAG: TolC family protein [Nevskia sp.]|nr:TolC family protein [Nevskia sp.]